MTDETTAAATTNEAEVPPLHPEIEKLLVVLDDVAANARYATDPRVPAQQIAIALAEYFRSPD